MSYDFLSSEIKQWKTYTIQRDQYILDVVELTMQHNNIITILFKRDKNFVYIPLMREYINFYSKNIQYVKLLNQLKNNEPIQL